MRVIISVVTITTCMDQLNGCMSASWTDLKLYNVNIKINNINYLEVTVKAVKMKLTDTDNIKSCNSRKVEDMTFSS